MTSITGRDSYILAKALYQAIKYQDQLKKNKSTFYEWSDQQDMKAILAKMFPGMAEVLVATDQFTHQEVPDLKDEKRAA